jgi:hypothetical protein
MGLVAHERLGARHGVFHRAGTLVMGADGDGNLALHGRHFGAGLPQRLAGFTGDGQGQRLLVLAEQVGIAAHDGKALFKGQIGPMVEGRAGRLDGRIHLGWLAASPRQITCFWPGRWIRTACLHRPATGHR